MMFLGVGAVIGVGSIGNSNSDSNKYANSFSRREKKIVNDSSSTLRFLPYGKRRYGQPFYKGFKELGEKKM